MRNRVFMGLSTFFMLFGSSSLVHGELGTQFQNLHCSKAVDASYELSWEVDEDSVNSTIHYHLFAANDWKELMPLSSAESFLATPQASTSYLLTTGQNSVVLPAKPSYVRLMAQQEGQWCDLARLIKFEAATEDPEALVCKGGYYSPKVTEEVWKQVGPYLMAEDHPARAFMDKICSETRILASTEALEGAGFKIIFQQLKRGLVVAKHPKLPGYLLKMYLDSSPRSEWPLWILRAKGARVVQGILDKHYYNCYMKVPQKWIYPVSQWERPTADESTFPKDFILVVQDMRLVTEKFNQYNYKNGMTFARLDALYKTIDEGGLSDSHIGNIPFSVDRKIAFIDTEYVYSWPVHFDWLTKYFSPLNQCYWLRLMREGELSKG